MIELIVYSPSTSPRLSYVLNFISSQYSNLSFRNTNNMEVFAKHAGFRINYSTSPISDQDFYIAYSSRLEDSIDQLKLIEPKGKNETLQLFDTPHGHDVFASIFWCLSRAEEYRLEKSDYHQRYQWNDSLLYDKLNPKYPIVDQWVDQLITQLNIFFGIKLTRNSNTTLEIGVDIDHFFKYKNKNFFKQSAGFIRDILLLKLSIIKTRIKSILDAKDDPYNSFDYLSSLQDSIINVSYFVLSGGKSKYDTNNALSEKNVTKILEKIKKDHTIGLHPSYNYLNKKDILSEEKNSLEKKLNLKIYHNRFHYLRMSLPESYHLLLEHGCEHDYSMGFADRLGYRAGTSHSFVWYDLYNEKVTELMIHPFAAMDRTMLSYLILAKEEAKSQLIELWNTHRRYQSTMHVVWHNSSFDASDEWQLYNNLLQEFVSYVRQNNYNI